jgi:hypothetical protein
MWQKVVSFFSLNELFWFICVARYFRDFLKDFGIFYNYRMRGKTGELERIIER